MELDWADPEERVTHALPRGRGAVGVARRLVADMAELAGFNGRASDAALVASELVTNAIVHGAGPVTLSVEHLGGRLRITVEDEGPRYPVLRNEDPRHEGGRGLRVVVAFSREFGFEPTERGKRVWAVVGP